MNGRSKDHRLKKRIKPGSPNCPLTCPDSEGPAILRRSMKIIPIIIIIVVVVNEKEKKKCTASLSSGGKSQASLPPWRLHPPPFLQQQTKLDSNSPETKPRNREWAESVQYSENSAVNLFCPEWQRSYQLIFWAIAFLLLWIAILSLLPIPMIQSAQMSDSYCLFIDHSHSPLSKYGITTWGTYYASRLGFFILNQVFIINLITIIWCMTEWKKLAV